MENEKDILLTAEEYFTNLKEMKQTTSDEYLDNFYTAAIALLEKYKILGQKNAIKKLLFIIDCVPKERELIKKGIDIFIYKDDIEDYINRVENQTVKIIEMENYPREIPDEFVEVIQETRDIFDNFYILFTDYTGKVEREIEKERRSYDPILFGVFRNKSIMNDRFYYLGDWIDEYCDLTLEKLLSEQGNIAKVIQTPRNKEELVEECRRLVSNDSDGWIHTGSSNESIKSSTTLSADAINVIRADTSKSNTKKSFISKVKTFLRK